MLGFAPISATSLADDAKRIVQIGAVTIRAAAASVSAAAFGQSHRLTNESVSGGAEVSAAVITARHNFDAHLVSSGVPAIAEAQFTLSFDLAGSVVRSAPALVGEAAFNMKARLSSPTVIASPATIAQLELFQIHAFGTVAIQSAFSVENAPFSQIHDLQPTDVRTAPAHVTAPEFRIRFVFGEVLIIGGARVPSALFNFGYRRAVRAGGSVNFAHSSQATANVAHSNQATANTARPT
jgi:hypothetical protein